MADAAWPEVYRKLGVRPVINAQSWVTRLGGSLMRPEVVRAMNEAATAFVDITELNRASGGIVAQACGAEAGVVTAGCASAQVLMSAACMTGTDPDKVARLPRTDGMKNEIVMFRGQRNHYDHMFEVAGARIVDFGDEEAGTPEQLDDAITENTCAVAFAAGPFLKSGIGLEETARVSHARDVPVLVDGAAEVPPRENLTGLIRRGADLVAFSGGKGIGGPQSTGLLAGRADLIAAVQMNMLSFDRPTAGIGRSMKVSKENLIGLVTAIQLTIDTDEHAEYQAWHDKSQYIAERIGGIDGLRVELEEASADRQGPQPVIYFQPEWEGPTAAEVRQRLLEGDPPIYVGGGGYGDEINIVMVNVQDGEERIIADRLLEIFSA